MDLAKVNTSDATASRERGGIESHEVISGTEVRLKVVENEAHSLGHGDIEEAYSTSACSKTMKKRHVQCTRL